MILDKRGKIAGVVALALVLVTTAFVGFAQNRDGRDGRAGFGARHGKGEGHRAGFGRMFRSLNLTEAQQSQIQQIAERNRQATASLREQLKANRKDRAGALNTGTFDEQAVRTAAQARATAQVELEVAHARMFSEMYAVLTPEQKTQLAAQREQHKQRRGERRGERWRGRDSKQPAAAPTTTQP